MNRFLIWSIEHTAWWRPGKWGYTDQLSEAGVYDDEDARAIVANANRVHFNEALIPVESTTRAPAPVASDEDLVMRFRNYFAETLEALPLEAFRDAKERRSTCVAMMLRAVSQEFIVHLGPNHKAMAYVFSQELQRAIDEAIDAAKTPLVKN
jgi:hypothetical protein